MNDKLFAGKSLEDLFPGRSYKPFGNGIVYYVNNNGKVFTAVVDLNNFNESMENVEKYSDFSHWLWDQKFNNNNKK